MRRENLLRRETRGVRAILYFPLSMIIIYVPSSCFILAIAHTSSMNILLMRGETTNRSSHALLDGRHRLVSSSATNTHSVNVDAH